MTHDQLAREFSELNGIPCTGSHGYLDGKECTFSDAASILKVMLKHPKWDSFLEIIGGYDEDGWQYVRAHYIYNKDSLLKVAVEWCKEN